MGTRVFVGGLNYRVRERDIEKFFKKYGRIREIAMKNGFAFVEFEDYRDADDAVYELNGKELLGDRVSVERARGTPRGSDQWRGSGRGHGGGGQQRGGGGGKTRDEKYGPPTRTEHRVIVENLSSRVSWQDLKDYMRQAGEVTYADAHKQRRNEGVVEFASYSDMKTALEKLDDTDLNGRRIHIVEDRRRGGGGSGGNKRSRSSSSRSRSRSASNTRKRSRSRSRRSSHSKSKSPARSKSRSRSKSKDRASKSRSRSVSKSNNKRSKSYSPENGRAGSHDRSRSRSISKGRSPDHDKSEKNDD